MRKYCRAFTLMEVLVVVIIVSVVLGFGIPSYYKQYERGMRKNAEAQLKGMQRAQKMYKTRLEKYYPHDRSSGDLYSYAIQDINDTLNININFSVFSYYCKDTGDPETYECAAIRDGGAYTEECEANGNSATCQSLLSQGDYILEIADNDSSINCTGRDKSCP